MSKWVRRFFGGIIGFLLLFLGIERRKNKKKAETIKKQEQQIAHEQTQSYIYKVESETLKEIEKLDEITEEDEEKEKELDEAETAEEIIAYANSSINDFNRVSDSTRAKKH